MDANDEIPQVYLSLFARCYFLLETQTGHNIHSTSLEVQSKRNLNMHRMWNRPVLSHPLGPF